jgi:hypothetical protein
MSKEKVPQYCLHKGSGQAYVKIGGRRIYLGPHNSTESRRRYSDEIDRWRELQQWGVLPDIRVGELIKPADISSLQELLQSRQSDAGNL